MPNQIDTITDSAGTETQAAKVLNNTLDPYVPSPDKPWNARRVAHLYRRLGFSATIEQIQQGLQMTPSALVDQLLNTAAALPAPTPPVWANWVSSDYNGDKVLYDQHREDMRFMWYTDMLDEGVRARMALFWHNHFVTELLVYGCNSYMWSYYSLLHEYAFSNFREFTVQMGKNPAMLVYLNGNLNEAGEPNENYARELMELFTMGESNGYTQFDVVEMSRALTGWQASFNECTAAFFDPAKFDNTPKTIFGQTGNFDFDSAHNLIFSERPQQVSHFVTGKIYRHFVYQHQDADIIEGLAATFRNNDWELLPVFKQLFKSEHFFEERFLNAKIKSPLDALLPIFKMGGVKATVHIQPNWFGDMNFYANQLGQFIVYGPPNVAGWPGHREWLNESRLTRRWNYCDLMLTFLMTNNDIKEYLRELARTLSNNSNDPVTITAALTDFFLGQSLGTIYFNGAVDRFKAGIPEGYYTDGSWNLNWDEVPDQIVNLYKYLVRMPEYQLT
ncbi:MAG: DUF1800 domain-containing protein [Lewinellaceae bacterium]|nr:DUF1800 domain-containing protein [Saprospiraceae bacterium]MCB9330158.1 DUF1800 domain-containing protein [Lewinellaceae bacterium]